jgi:hypothetical protein
VEKASAPASPTNFPHQQLKVGNRHGQEQFQRTALAFADDGVVTQNQGDQRHQINHQANQTGDGDIHAAKADRTLLRCAEIGDHQGEHGKNHRHRQYPAIADAIPEFFAGDHADLLEFDARFHAVVSPKIFFLRGSELLLQTLPTGVIEVFTVAIQRVHHLDRASLLRYLLILTGHRLRASQHIRYDEMQHFIGILFQMAIFHDIRHFGIDLGGEFVVALGIQLIFMDCRQTRRKGIFHTDHALAQHIVSLPLFTILQVQLGGGGALFVLMRCFGGQDQSRW